MWKVTPMSTETFTLSFVGQPSIYNRFLRVRNNGIYINAEMILMRAKQKIEKYPAAKRINIYA
jgi:hypothetical protein